LTFDRFLYKILSKGRDNISNDVVRETVRHTFRKEVRPVSVFEAVTLIIAFAVFVVILIPL